MKIDKKAAIMGVVISCPLNQRKHDCVAGKLRTLSPADISSFLTKFTEEKLDEILTDHNLCAARRKAEQVS
jgi:hypothetical protein